jgi:hypothetical protein
MGFFTFAGIGNVGVLREAVLSGRGFCEEIVIGEDVDLVVPVAVQDIHTAFFFRFLCAQCGNAMYVIVRRFQACGNRRLSLLRLMFICIKNMGHGYPRRA